MRAIRPRQFVYATGKRENYYVPKKIKHPIVIIIIIFLFLSSPRIRVAGTR